MFVTASPELVNWNDSVSALTFASRCRSVDLGAGRMDRDAAATEAELAAANKKISELTALLKLRS